MKKSSVILLTLATCFCIVGGAAFLTVMAYLNFDFKQLSTEKYVTNTYEIESGFIDVFIDESVSDIEFRLSENDKCKILCFEEVKTQHKAYTDGTSLIVETEDKREWHDYIGISLYTPKLTVCLPEKEYNSLEINVDTGDVVIPDGFKFKNLKIKGDTSDIVCNLSNAVDVKLTTSTGKIELNNLECTSLKVKASTGDVFFNNVVATSELTAYTSTGDVSFKDTDGGKITVKTSTGDVKGNFLTEKTFKVNTSTGNVKVPKTTNGEICEITTSTGDIRISVGKLD